MTDPENSEHILRQVFQDLLQPGQAFRVEKTAAGKLVVEAIPAGGQPRGGALAQPAGLRALHPDLHARLAAASQRISESSGCWLLAFFFCAGLMFGKVLHDGTLKEYVTSDGALSVLNTLDGATGYVVSIVLCIALWGSLDTWLETRTYRRLRPEILEQIDAKNLDPYQVMAMMDAGSKDEDAAKSTLRRRTTEIGPETEIEIEVKDTAEEEDDESKSLETLLKHMRRDRHLGDVSRL